MPDFAIANLAAPRILTQAGNVFVLACIVIVEAIALGTFFKKTLKTPRSFPQVLLVCLLANTIASVAGIPFVFNEFFAVNPGTAFFSLPFFWVTSAFIEWPIYIGFFRKKSHPPIFKLLKAAFLSNLYSTALFLVILQPWTYSSELFSVHNPRRAEWETREAIAQIIKVQEKFLLEKSRFAKDFKELKEVSSSYQPVASEFAVKTNGNAENEFHQFTISSTRDRAEVSASAKEKSFKSYKGFVVALKKKNERQIIWGICQTKQPSTQPPETPKLAGDEIECPAGSERA